MSINLCMQTLGNKYLQNTCYNIANWGNILKETCLKNEILNCKWSFERLHDVNFINSPCRWGSKETICMQPRIYDHRLFVLTRPPKQTSNVVETQISGTAAFFFSTQLSGKPAITDFFWPLQGWCTTINPLHNVTLFSHCNLIDCYYENID